MDGGYKDGVYLAANLQPSAGTSPITSVSHYFAID